MSEHMNSMSEHMNSVSEHMNSMSEHMNIVRQDEYLRFGGTWLGKTA